MRAIKVKQDLKIDSETLLVKGETLKVIKNENGGGNYWTKSGRRIRTCTIQFANKMVDAGLALPIFWMWYI